MFRKTLSLTAALLSVAAFAQSENPDRMGSAEAAKIRAVVKAANRNLSKTTGKDGSFVVELNARWLKKCDALLDKRRHCSLDECDFKEHFGNGCRKDKVLIFRGERRPTEFPTIAALARSHMRGSDFLQKTPDASDPAGVSRALLAQLAEETVKMGQVRDVPETAMILSSGNAGRSWFSVDEVDNVAVAVDSLKEKQAFGAPLIVYGIHVVGNRYVYTKKDLRRLPDPMGQTKTDVSLIDPLLSYSYGVSTPMQFAEPKKKGEFGRIIILSLERKKILGGCPKFGENEFHEPGTYWDPSHCPISQATKWSESELDAIMYPDADDIAGSFLIPFGLEVDLGEHFAG